jgi:hypothetical protein
MPTKPVPSASGRSARQPSRQRILTGLVVAGFCVLLLGYLVLYGGALIGGSGFSRFDLLRFRLLLPEQSAANWFGSPASFSLFDRVPIIALAALVLAFGWLLGMLLLGLSRLDAGLTPLERAVFAVGIGVNTLSLYVLAMGLAGWLSRASILMPAAAVAVAGLWRFYTRRQAADARRLVAPPPGASSEAPPGASSTAPLSSASSPQPNGSPEDWLGWRWAALAAPFAVAILLGGMLPPIDFDVREYHLEAPKEFYQQGRIEFLPHNVYGNMPLGSEMLSLLAMVLLDDWWLGALVGKTLIAAFAPLTALALLAIGQRFFSTTAGVVAALIYLSVPWIALVSASGLIEGVLAFYLLLSLYAVMLWRHFPPRDPTSAGAEEIALPRSSGDQASDLPLRPAFSFEGGAGWLSGTGRLALAGFCAGAAVSCKYPALLFVAAPLLLAIAWSSRPRFWRPMALFLLALTAGCGLWFAKNWAFTGNPTYPLLYDWFGGATRSIEKNLRWQRAHSPAGFSFGSLRAAVESLLWKSDWLSPILVPLALMACLARRHRRRAAYLAAYLAFVFGAWWCCTHRIDRFWIPVTPVAALLAGVGATWSSSLAWRRVLLATLGLGMGMSLLLITGRDLSDNRYFVRLDRLRGDPSRGRAWHCVLNAQLPPGHALLSVGDAAVFDLRMPVYYNTAFDDSMLELICQGRGPLEIAAELERLRISHIYVHWGELARYRQPGNYGGVPDFVTPDWFADLVRQGVLGPPLRLELILNQEVYPVVRLPAQLGEAAWPRLTPVAVGAR